MLTGTREQHLVIQISISTIPYLEPLQLLMFRSGIGVKISGREVYGITMHSARYMCRMNLNYSKTGFVLPWPAVLPPIKTLMHTAASPTTINSLPVSD